MSDNKQPLMTYSEALEVLKKRMNWLDTRINSSDRDLSHDRKELQALEAATELLQDEIALITCLNDAAVDRNKET